MPYDYHTKNASKIKSVPNIIHDEIIFDAINPYLKPAGYYAVCYNTTYGSSSLGPPGSFQWQIRSLSEVDSLCRKYADLSDMLADALYFVKHGRFIDDEVK